MYLIGVTSGPLAGNLEPGSRLHDRRAGEEGAVTKGRARARAVVRIVMRGERDRTENLLSAKEWCARIPARPVYFPRRRSWMFAVKG